MEQEEIEKEGTDREYVKGLPGYVQERVEEASCRDDDGATTSCCCTGWRPR